MSRPTITNATGSGPGTQPCGWKSDCQKHHTVVGYPKGGILGRTSLSGWTHPSAMLLKENPTTINDTHTSIKLGGKKVSGQNYSFQRHHVIPVQAFNNLPDLKDNLELLGYNINIQDQNGISLPFRIKDLVWHDLQFHRGSHPAYTTIVTNRVRKIMNTSKRYCEKGEQSTLWDLIKEEVDLCRDELISWNLYIHTWAAAERPIQFLAWT